MQIVSVSLQKYSEHITQNSFRIRAKQGRKLFPAPLTLFLSLYREEQWKNAESPPLLYNSFD